MVGRFQSPELKREALAHEDRYQSIPSTSCSCCFLMCGALFLAGLVTRSTGTSTDSKAKLELEFAVARDDVAASMYADSTTSSFQETAMPKDVYSLYGLNVDDEERYGTLSGNAFGDGFKYGMRSPRDEVAPLKLDFSLVAFVVAIFALCLAPSLYNSLCTGGMQWTGAPTTFAGTASGSLLTPAFGTPSMTGGLLGADYSSGAARGRVVDVKPGDLRGSSSFLGVGRRDLGGGLSWSGAASRDSGSTGPFGGGTWASPVPTAYRAGSSSLSGSTGVSNMLSGSSGTASTLGGSGISWIGLGGAHNQSASAALLPTEAEVTETYAGFGVQLQQWVPALAELVDKSIIDPLLRELDASDQLWRQTLQQRGWRFSHDAPFVGSGAGMGPATQELSVFDRNLPRPLCDDPGAVELWNRRQLLESFLTHPSFEPGQRQAVLERLREWRQRGLLNGMRYEWRANSSSPTDVHILENVIVKMLQIHLDFASCFMSAGHAPPLTKHQGLSPTAYLRQVTDQSQLPRSAPHYEVVTLAKVWKLRPGNNNVLEALALLLHTLRRQSKSYQAFPQNLRTALEAATGGAGAASATTQMAGALSGFNRGMQPSTGLFGGIGGVPGALASLGGGPPGGGYALGLGAGVPMGTSVGVGSSGGLFGLPGAVSARLPSWF